MKLPIHIYWMLLGASLLGTAIWAIDTRSNLTPGQAGDWGGDHDRKMTTARTAMMAGTMAIVLEAR